MRILPERRDIFPKIDLDGGYLADRLPLCAELPAGAFLRIGAVYVYVGQSE